MKWCEHIKYQPIENMGRGFIWRHSLNSSTLGTYCASDWKFCPDCGTPRPVDKTLAQKLGEVSQDCRLSWPDVYRKQATCALEHFLGVVDVAFGDRRCISKEEFKDAMKESVK